MTTLPVSCAKATIAIDAMGGDYAPYNVIAGIASVIQAHPDVSLLLYGDQNIIQPILTSFPLVQKASTIVHTDVMINPEEKPSVALRQGRQSSMRLAIDAVAEQRADAMISGGNTGALMAMSKVVLRTLEGIDRPAISATFPTRKGKSVMLDLGANVECTVDNLFQFALMGNAFAKVVLGRENPSVGLLNVGSEEGKGNETVKAAAALLKKHFIPLQFYGYIEGHDIAEGTVDVVVTDGFTGNIALKTAEGTAQICSSFLKQAFQSSLLAKLGFLLAKTALKRTFRQIDHRSYNGAMFVGLNGVVVKSHGSADAVAYAQALKVTIELVKQHINQKIVQELHALQSTPEEDVSPSKMTDAL